MNITENIIYVTAVEQLPQIYKFLDKKINKVDKLLAIDTETTGFSPIENRPVLIQIGDTTVQYVLDCARLQDRAIIELLTKIQESGFYLIAHNAKFDYCMLASKYTYGIDLEYWACTFLMHKLLVMGLLEVKSGLADLVERYFRVKLDKADREYFGENIKFGDPIHPDAWKYAGRDIAYLIPLYKKLLDLLQKHDLFEVAKLENKAMRCFGEMELNGLYIDQKKWLQLKAEAEVRANETYDLMAPYLLDPLKGAVSPNLFGHPSVNLNSHQEMKPVIEKIIGEKIPSTGKEILELYKDKHPFVGYFLEYKKAVKLVSTYGSEFLEKHVSKVDGRLHPSYKQLGAATGRSSSNNPNIQNIPKLQKYRDPFIAEKEDHVIVAADFAAQEVRLLIHLSNDPGLLEAVNTGKDLHAASASILFQIPYIDFFHLDSDGKIKLDPDSGEPVFKKEMKKNYRDKCKSITFG